MANVANDRFEWLWSVVTRGIADGHHIFELGRCLKARPD
jgi:hypothetical protein